MIGGLRFLCFFCISLSLLNIGVADCGCFACGGWEPFLAIPQLVFGVFATLSGGFDISFAVEKENKPF